MNFPRIDSKGLARFLRYGCVGGGTFLLDLGLLYIFTSCLGLSPVIAAGPTFLIAVSINYLISRKMVFKGSSRPLKHGYLGFLLIAGTGLVIVTGGMLILVNFLHWQYLISRVAVSLITGMWNYLLNLYVNFRVAGRHI
ncbi:GtrA family protein [Maridesulfovibrio sp.]|uniref:GtrA family protein n=1 Tax=Maridesulfovibrio sp. TaxID=2795000 RepID=UPI002A18C860|nr:GtrA family protein [Maridesulfovibrio sp.]